MLKIDQALQQLARKWEWQLQHTRDRQVRVQIHGHGGWWEWTGYWTADQEVFVCCSFLPVNLPEERHQESAELLARINYRLLVGNFDLDLRDGEISFRTSTMLHRGQIGSAELQNLVIYNLSTMDKYLPAILAVAFGDKSPTKALDDVLHKIEQEQEETQANEEESPAVPRGDLLRRLQAAPSNN